jgi:hypothetical protein
MLNKKGVILILLAAGADVSAVNKKVLIQGLNPGEQKLVAEISKQAKKLNKRWKKVIESDTESE